MAQVPTYGAHQAMPTILGYRPMSDDIPNVPRADIEGSIGRVGDALDKHYTKFLEEQDEARVTAALTDLRRKAIDMESGEGGWASMLGENALTPDEEGAGLVERSDRGLQEYGTSLAEKFTPRQQKLFNEKAQSIYQAAYAGVSQHVYRQSVEQKKSVQEGVIAQAVESGVAYVGKPDMLKQNEALIEESSHKLASFLGWTPENTAMYVKKNTSAMYMNGITSLLAGADKNPAVGYLALGVLNAHSKKMLASDVARARQQINPIVQAYEDRMKVERYAQSLGGNGEVLSGALGSAIASGAIKQDAVMTARGYEALISVASHGGHQSVTTKDGAPTDWKHGASQITVEQAMEAAKEGGYPWDVKAFKTDRDYNQALGLTRYNGMLTEFAGDEQKAMAGYLTSKDAVRDAEKKAAEKGGTWVEYLPKKARTTLQSATANMREMKQVVDSATGKTVSGFDPRYAAAAKTWPTVEEMRAHFRATDARAEADPEYCDGLVAKANALVNQKKQSYVQTQNNVKAQISNILFQSHGDMSKIPQSLFQQLDVNELADVQKLAKHYQSDTFASNPFTLGKLADDSFLVSLQKDELTLYLNELNGKDRQHYMARWQMLNQKAVVADDERANQIRDAQLGIVQKDFVVESSKVKATLRTNPTIAKMFEEHPEAAGIIVDAVQQELSLRGQMRGTKLNEVDVKQEIWAAARESVSVSGLFSNTDKPAILLEVKDLPNQGNTDAMRILKATAKSYVQMQGQDREPTEAELQYCLTKIMLGGDKLRVVIPPDVGFDNSLMREVKDEWARKHGDRPMPMNQQARYYLMARAAGRFAKPDMTKSAYDNLYMEITE